MKMLRRRACPARRDRNEATGMLNAIALG